MPVCNIFVSSERSVFKTFRGLPFESDLAAWMSDIVEPSGFADQLDR